MSSPSPTGAQSHAKHGPSSLRYKEICPGYESRQSDNPVALMGSRIHAALETDDFSGLENDFEAMLANKCLEAREKLFRHYNFTPVETHRELRLEIDLADGLTTFGTADEILVNGSTALAIDWKCGRGAIDDASVNAQAQAYTLGIFQKFPEIQQVHFNFVIPQRDEITFNTFTREDIPTLTLRLSTIIRRAEHIHELWASGNQPSPDLLTPHTSICCYCANQYRCPSLTKFALNLAGKYSKTDIEIPDVVHGSEIDDPEVIAKMLPLAPILKTWAEGITKRAKDMVLEDGVEIPGFIMRERSGSKTVTDAAAAWELMKSHMTIEEFLAMMKDISFTSLAAVVYDKAPHGKKSAAKNQLEDDLRDMCAIKDAPKQQFLAPERK